MWEPADEVRAAIAKLGISPRLLAPEIQERLAWLDEHPEARRQDLEGPFGGAWVCQFRLDAYKPTPPRFTVAYDVELTPQGHVTWILGFQIGFVQEDE